MWLLQINKTDILPETYRQEEYCPLFQSHHLSDNPAFGSMIAEISTNSQVYRISPYGT